MRFDTTDEIGLWQFFQRTERRNFDLDNVVCGELRLPRNTDLATAISLAIRARVISHGSHRSGVFQVQTDDGIFSQVNDRRIDLSTPRRAALVTMKTWEQLEEEENASR